MQDPAPQNPCVCREMIWKMVGDLHGGQVSYPCVCRDATSIDDTHR